MVPVSIRTGDEEDTWTNSVSGLVVDLPTDLADPLERVARVPRGDGGRQAAVRAGAGRGVDRHQAVRPAGGRDLGDPPGRRGCAWPTGSTRPSTSSSPTCPARASRSTSGGAKLDQYIPVSTIAEGMGLNITVHSYLDELTFGLIACRELVPDLWDMVDLHVDEIDGSSRPPAPSGRPRRRPLHPAAARRRSPGRHRRRKKAAAKRAPAKKKAAAKKAPAKKAPAKKKAATTSRSRRRT